MAEEDYTPNTIELATELTVAWLNNPSNRAAAEDVPAFLERMHQTLAGLSSNAGTSPAAATENAVTPAVSVRKSLGSKDHIISLIDGKPYKSLKRHLSRHGLTPAQYRERYGLKPDYPMVAENYALQRRELALAIGLGSKGRAARKSKAAAAPKVAAKAPRKPRAPKAS
jgi:predicted transcriptional regulator